VVPARGPLSGEFIDLVSELARGVFRLRVRRPQWHDFAKRAARLLCRDPLSGPLTGQLFEDMDELAFVAFWLGER
jgi:hypothetical protein